MDNQNQEPGTEKTEEEIDWEAFFAEDEEENKRWEQEKEQRKKRRSFIIKIFSSIIAFSMLVSGLGVWFNVFNIPAFQFVEASNRLSKKPEIKEYKESVVVVEWDGVRGTGFNIRPDGYIITNEHVVDHTNQVHIHTKKQGSYLGKVIATFPEEDLAIVDIEANNLPALSISSEENWEQRTDEKVYFIGNPLGFVQVANEGTIAGTTQLNDSKIPFLMIDAPIYKGNSGSPVINEQGEVIAVIFATLRNPKMGLATPSSYLKTIIEETQRLE